MPVLHCFDYCSLVVRFEIMKCESFSFVLFQGCFGYLGSLDIHLDFRMGFSTSAKNIIGILKNVNYLLLKVTYHWNFDKDYIKCVDQFGYY